MTPLPFEARDYLLLLPAVRRRHGAGLRGPGTSRPTATAGAERRYGGRPGGRAPPGRAGATRSGDLAGREPTLAGSGSTWFVEGGPAEAGTATRRGCGSGARRARLVRARRCRRAGTGTERSAEGGRSYLPARRCQRVAFSIFLCFFLRIRLRRFLISDPMSCGRLAVPGADCQVGPEREEAAMGFEIVGLDHVQLAMPPGGEARGRGLLLGAPGLDRVPKPEPLAGRGGCWFAAGAVAVHLGVEEDFRPARKAHPALVVVRDLAGLGGAAAAGTTAAESWRCSGRTADRRRPGRRGGYVDDPFGNRTCELMRTQRRTGGGGASAVWTTVAADRLGRRERRSSGVRPAGRHGRAGASTCGPRPRGSFSATIVPPSALTTWATMARPRPDPGRPRAAGER